MSDDERNAVALSLSTSARDGFSVLTVGGEIDLQTAPELREAVDAMLADGATKLVVDLDAVDFLDSSALGALVGINKRLTSGSALWLVCSKPNLLRLFQITKLTEAFTIVSSVDDIRR